MRRLARRLFALCSGVSLLLCAVVCVLWVRSYWVGEDLGRKSTSWSDDGWETQRVARVASSYGDLWLWCRVTQTSYATNAANPSREPTTWHYYSAPATGHLTIAPIRTAKGPHVTWEGRTLIGRFGFGLQRSVYAFNSDPPSRPNQTVVLLPMWSLALAFLTPPSLWVGLRRRTRAVERRRCERKCVRCGYDLRASPERCPECGAVPEMTT